ncbi:DUF502 domain-containing protein [Candidatus Margulisiibacteriota bacterium]
MVENKHPESIRGKFGKYFFNGLILLFPLAVTIYILQLLVGIADNILTAPLQILPWAPPQGVGLIVSILFIIILGYLGTNVFITRIFGWAEKAVIKIPIVKSIYSTAKQINEILFLQKEKTMFRKACLIPYPHPGVYTVAFLTNEAPLEIEQKTKKDLLNVFVPSTPTPATGFMVLVPRNMVIPLDMNLDDALKLIVSGGVLSKHKFKELPELKKD